MEDVLGRAPARAPTRFPTLNVLLFLATVATTLVSGWSMVGPRISVLELPGSLFTIARAGLPFAAALLGILFAHEMGHYVLARRYRVDATLPFFIPFVPWFMGGIGTLGAVIRIRSRMPSRRAVLDIGAAGPIAGFVVAVPLLVWGYAQSPEVAAADLGMQSPLADLVDLVRGVTPPADGQIATVFGRNLVSSAALALTHPNLGPGMDVAEHPVAIAAWFGLLVTALNLIPIGQLDGGHVTYALLGRERARRASQVVSWGLLVLGLTLSYGWLLWWLLTRFIVGHGHPPAIVEEPLPPGRRVLAVASLVLFVITFAPIPIRTGLVP
ncbi:MAG TPA: site-2 protease family protein [Anaeromyxobacter sp.]|nr:site-2 protease family protein [Anaeromyxobacter sp.]